MKLSQFKEALTKVDSIHFLLPDASFVAPHFHITEAGLTTKTFVDCGGTLREEKTANLQVWVASDVTHRLTSSKLIGILNIADNLFKGEDLEMEIEYQTSTLGRYGLDFDGMNFLLIPRSSDCLAKDSCGVPQEKRKVELASLGKEETSCCTPGGGCC